MLWPARNIRCGSTPGSAADGRGRRERRQPRRRSRKNCPTIHFRYAATRTAVERKLAVPLLGSGSVGEHFECAPVWGTAIMAGRYAKGTGSTRSVRGKASATGSGSQAGGRVGCRVKSLRLIYCAGESDERQAPDGGAASKVYSEEKTPIGGGRNETLDAALSIEPTCADIRHRAEQVGTCRACLQRALGRPSLSEPFKSGIRRETAK